MGFRKLGLAYRAQDHVSPWARHSALTPTPVLHPDGQIRVFAGFRDSDGVSRIGYVDLDAQDPTRVLAVSAKPSLDIGRSGCFDDNGVILGDVVREGRRLLLFYVGFQRTAKVKFLAFSGLAESHDEGETFDRLQETPVLDRAPGQSMIAAIHTAMPDGNGWRLWLARGDGWQTIGGDPFPRYEICHVRTRDLLQIPAMPEPCIAPKSPEYRIGRPRVWRTGDAFEMWYTKGTIAGDYLPGRAVSTDGVRWQRMDRTVGLSPGPEAWDDAHVSYLAPLEVGGRRYVFYNGNHMGRDGFGVAVEEPSSA